VNNYTPLARMLIHSGVPTYYLNKAKDTNILKIKFPFYPTTQLDDEEKAVVIPPAKQEFFAENAHKIFKPWRVLIYSRGSALWSQMLMLKIYTKTAQRLMKNEIKNFMKWHLLESNYEDTLLEEMKDDVYPAPYLVLDNLFSTTITNPIKTEKIRSILLRYPLPIFIIMNGNTPYKTFVTDFKMKPNFVLYTGVPKNMSSQ
jgi:hypothetical protein